MTQHLMLIPSLACPASCSYCFGPHLGKERMSDQVLQAIVDWQNCLRDSDKIEITFHGGEPLLPGYEFYQRALPLFRDGLASRPVRFAIQSNLWLLTDPLSRLFREYNVSIGTSLDGPRFLNDRQRGEGYFEKTIAGVERARKNGLEPGFICTFTRQSLPHAQEVFDFFLKEGLNFSIHAAVPSLHFPDHNGWSLTAEEHGALLVEMLDRYLQNLTRVRVSTLDSLCQSVSAGHGGICTFRDCLGDYLAVGPDGAIYPCQRFAGLPEFVIANVLDRTSLEDMEKNPVWQAFQSRQVQIAEQCSDCVFLPICRGGCPYNALAAKNGNSTGNLKDPYCEGYQRIFSYITERAVQEVFSSENLAEVIERPDDPKGLFQRGKLVPIMRGGPHPFEIAQHARRLLAAVALASFSPQESALKLHAVGAIQNSARSLSAIQALSHQLSTPSVSLNNLYLHVTFTCNLRCSHCYASADEQQVGAMALKNVARACREAARLNFRHVVITGGEPLTHPQVEDLLDTLAGLREEIKPLLTVLRTNLTIPMDHRLLCKVGYSTDQVVVSLDGDRVTHDQRRGLGNYDSTQDNLHALVNLRNEMGEKFTDLSLAAVLSVEQINSAPGAAVRAIADELGIRRTRFRPLLPIGRAIKSELEIAPEALWSHLSGEDMLSYGFSPNTTCGLGQNLYVEPDGAAYPCYAWHGEQWSLGNIFQETGLPMVTDGLRFRNLSRHTVDANPRCRACELRYLCGGACRAWNRYPEGLQKDLDAPPLDCSRLHHRARTLFLSAMQQLDIPAELWIENGLPLPDSPPMLSS